MNHPSLPHENASGKELEVWQEMVAKGGLALRGTLTVIETGSGLTAALVRDIDIDMMGRGGFERTLGGHLIVMSVLRSGGMTFEEHGSHIIRYKGKRRDDRTDYCGRPCTRNFLLDGRILEIDSDHSKVTWDSAKRDYDEPLSYAARTYGAWVRNAQPGQDVFLKGNAACRVKAESILERHQLMSPAANEAFGRPHTRALPQR